MARRKNVHDKVKEIIDIYLLEHIGEKAVSGWPRFDEDRRRWIVTILCESPQGAVPAGRIELDENLNIIYVTPRDDMVRAVEEQLRRKPFLVYADKEKLKAKGFEVITL
jgi:hypothetical protein